MSSVHWLLRALVAIAATAVSSAFIVAVVSAIRLGSSSWIEGIAFIWFFGTLFAAVYASIIAIAVELPKTIVLSRKASGGVIASLLLSLGGAFIILTGFPLIAAEQSFSVGDPFLLWVMILSGGICSAIAWWFLLVAPLRARRTLR